MSEPEEKEKFLNDENLDNIWKTNAKFIKKLVGDVDVKNKGNLQQQIDDTNQKLGGLEFGVSDRGCLTITYDDDK